MTPYWSTGLFYFTMTAKLSYGAYSLYFEGCKMQEDGRIVMFKEGLEAPIVLVNRRDVPVAATIHFGEDKLGDFLIRPHNRVKIKYNPVTTEDIILTEEHWGCPVTVEFQPGKFVDADEVDNTVYQSALFTPTSEHTVVLNTVLIGYNQSQDNEYLNSLEHGTVKDEPTGVFPESSNASEQDRWISPGGFSTSGGH